MPFVPGSFLLLVVRPGATSSVLAAERYHESHEHYKGKQCALQPRLKLHAYEPATHFGEEKPLASRTHWADWENPEESDWFKFNRILIAPADPSSLVNLALRKRKLDSENFHFSGLRVQTHMLLGHAARPCSDQWCPCPCRNGAPLWVAALARL